MDDRFKSKTRFLQDYFHYRGARAYTIYLYGISCFVNTLQSQNHAFVLHALFSLFCILPPSLPSSLAFPLSPCPPYTPFSSRPSLALSHSPAFLRLPTCIAQLPPALRRELKRFYSVSWKGSPDLYEESVHLNEVMLLLPISSCFSLLRLLDLLLMLMLLMLLLSFVVLFVVGVLLCRPADAADAAV